MPPWRCRCRARRRGFCSLSPSAFDPHAEAVRIAQIHHCAERRELVRLVRRHETRELRLGGLRVAPELELEAVGELQLPGKARAQRESFDRAREGRQKLREARVAASKFRLAAGRAAEKRQPGCRFAGKALALYIDETACCPARERNMLFDAHCQAVRPY